MSKELKIGIVSILALAFAIWGFQFMKGKNLLGKVQTFKTTYPNVEGLKMAAPVEINGYVVGAVSDISLDPTNAKGMIVSFDVQGEWNIPKNTKALLAADNSLVGSKKIILTYDTVCSGGDCAQTGDVLTPGSRGMLEAVLGKDELSSYIKSIRQDAGPIADTILAHLSGEGGADNAVSNSLQKLETSMNHLASLTASMDNLMKKSYGNLNTTIENMAVITSTLANTNGEIKALVSNLSTVSDQLANANIGGTMTEANAAVQNTNQLITDLKLTADNANKSLASMNEILQKVDNGDGAISKLLNNPQIYNNLEETSRHLALLLQDVRLNPKRYVRLSVFGRKGNQYTTPAEDPAYDQLDREEEKTKNN